MSRFRIYPTREQEAALLAHCGHARFVWNLACEQQTWWRPGRGNPPAHAERNRQLTEARREFPWLAAGSVTVQQQALRDFQQAMTNFFSGSHRRPTWRKAGQHEGFRIVGSQARRVVKLSRKWSAVKVPKVGWVKLRRSRTIPDAASYRITRDRAGRWHIAFVAIPETTPAPETGEVVGVDRGVAASIATSTGELSSVPGLTAGEAERKLRLERRLARARKGSNRRKKLKQQLARLRAREADRRTDWIEQTSTWLARRFDVIVLEDLNIRAMTASAKGTVDQPGRNVRQKAGLNRGVLASGWGRLATRLEHKAPGRVVYVEAAYTSQRCSTCGHVAAESRESQVVFRCVACNVELHADVNAAINIASAAGRAVPAHGDLQTQVGSAKWEPPTAAQAA